MKAEPGAELACRARNHKFEYGGRTVEHGVVSYYASRSFPQATTMASWLALIDAAGTADLRTGRLPSFLQVSLGIVGDPKTPLPGTTVRRR